MTTPSTPAGWKHTLGELLPLLGHRNWIVVTDMAYPMQSGHGITTLFANEPFEQVVTDLVAFIRQLPHVFAHTYLDSEQTAMDETLVEGWGAYRQSLDRALGDIKPVYLPHEQLIARLDNAGRMFNTIIIKTPLTKPYTSVFFELDCGYWDADREATLRTRLAR